MLTKFINFLIKYKILIMILFDSISVILVLFASYWIRLEYLYFPYGNFKLQIAIFISPILALFFFKIFGTYRIVIRFFSIESFISLNMAITFYAFTWGIITYMLDINPIPRSVILINWILITLIIGSSRIFAKWLLEETKLKINILIYGAGSAGRQLSNALKLSKNYKPIGFIDDDIKKHKKLINGIYVYSPQSLDKILNKKLDLEIFIAMPSIDRFRKKKIISYLEKFNLPIRSLPDFSKIAQGKVKISDLLEIDIKDLLGRSSISPNKELLELNITGKVVMVTGAGGSIGSELCRQIYMLKPKKLILYDLSEKSLYEIEQNLLNINKFNVQFQSVLGSLESKTEVLNILNSYSVETIYHAAGYKHVPIVESNIIQGIKNNLLRTVLLAEAAIESNVKTFVFVSTDKAVRPSNYMGASKRAAEIAIQSLFSEYKKTKFTIVRFGNVMGSSGSVIPLFKKQIQAGGPITVTDPNVTRYFMMIPEAVELIIQAGSMGKGGEVFILDMGQPIKIFDLALRMIRLSGLSVYDESTKTGDIAIKFIGLRAGEKLYEELIVGDKITKTLNEFIFKENEDFIEWNELRSNLIELEKSMNKNELSNTINILKKIVPEFSI